MKAPPSENEAARIDALRRYEILDTSPEPGFDGITRLASYVFGAPIALISLVDEDRLWFKSRVGADLTELPREHSFCDSALSTREVFVVTDARADPRFADNPIVASGPQLRFYAGATLVTPEGLPIGTVCVADPTPRHPAPAQLEALRALADQVMNQLELRRHVSTLDRTIAGLERAEAAVRESEEKYRFLFESNPEPMFVYDRETLRFLAVNAAATRKYGYTREEFLTISALDIRPEEDVPTFLRRISTVPDWTQSNTACRHRKKDGTVFDVEVTADTVRFGGRPARLVVADDVTERTHAEQALRETETRYRLAARATRDAIWDWDLRTDKIIWNDGVTTLFGYAEADVDPDVSWWEERLHPAERDRVARSRHATIAGRDEVWSDEYRFRRADGSYADVLDRGYVMRAAAGQPLRMVGAMIDMTEMKRAEAVLKEWKNRYEAAVLASGQILYDWDPVTNEVTYGGSVEKILGYSFPEMAGGLDHWRTLIHPDDLAAFDGQIRRVLETKEPFRLEYRVRRKDGSYIPTRDDGYFFFDASGAIVRMVGYVVDVTERKRLEEQLRHSQKMEAVGSLAGGVAHDFNNILTAIVGYCDLIENHLPEDDPLQREVVEIRRAGERASALTRQLLAFGSRQVLQPKVLDLNEVVSDMEGILSRLIGEHVELVFEPAPSLHPVRADQGQIEQVIMNLALNARDAMVSSGRLRLETRNITIDGEPAPGRPSLPCGEYVLLSVSDTGTGIDRSVLDRIFEPFFTTKERGKGTGLGLSMVYGIIKQSGGAITVESEAGSGSIFRIYLPRASALAAREAPREAPPEATTAPRSGTGTLLLVEDEEVVRRLVLEVLRGQGYSVLAAPNAAEALDLASRHAGTIDLLVTDVVLPGMSGAELARRMGAARPETRVLFISGYTGEAIARHGMLEPGIAFLHKPFTPSEIARKVRELLFAAR